MEHLPYIVSWNLTRRCNLRCKHCYIDASTAGPRELAKPEVLRVCEEIADVNPETMLILSGGEPLLHPDLDALVSLAALRRMTTVLGTNGTLLTAERARALAGQGLMGVGISLDSLLSQRHDEFRGKEGAWSGAVRGIEAALAAGLDAQVQFTLTRGNLEEMPEVLRFVRESGVRVLTVFFLVCTGRGQGLVDLSPAEYEVALESLARIRDPQVMVRPRCAPTFRRVVAQMDPASPLLQSDAGRCLAGKNYCRITPEGDVTPCPYMPLVAGNLRERSFGEIWGSSAPFLALRRPELKGKCGACEYRDVCGGCRARAFAAGGDYLGEDPWCVHTPGTGTAPPKPEEPLRWTDEAESRLRSVPLFVRRMVRSAVEAFARKQGAPVVTPQLMDEVRRKASRFGSEI